MCRSVHVGVCVCERTPVSKELDHTKECNDLFRLTVLFIIVQCRGLEPGGGSPANEETPHLGVNVPARCSFNF